MDGLTCRGWLSISILLGWFWQHCLSTDQRPFTMHSFGAEKGDFNCVDVSHNLRSNLACFPHPFRCSLDGQRWPEIELRDSKIWERCMQTLLTDSAAQEGSGGRWKCIFCTLSHYPNWRRSLALLAEKPGLAVRVLVPFWEGMARHHHAEDILTAFGAGTGTKLVSTLQAEP